MDGGDLWPAPEYEPMTQEQYDDLSDIAKAAILDDKTYLPAAFWAMWRALGVLAHTKLDSAEFAASTLQQVATSAWDAGDRYDPQGSV